MRLASSGIDSSGLFAQFAIKMLLRYLASHCFKTFCTIFALTYNTLGAGSRCWRATSFQGLSLLYQLGNSYLCAFRLCIRRGCLDLVTVMGYTGWQKIVWTPAFSLMWLQNGIAAQPVLQWCQEWEPACFQLPSWLHQRSSLVCNCNEVIYLLANWLCFFDGLLNAHWACFPNSSERHITVTHGPEMLYWLQVWSDLDDFPIQYQVRRSKKIIWRHGRLLYVEDEKSGHAETMYAMASSKPWDLWWGNQFSSIAKVGILEEMHKTSTCM